MSIKKFTTLELNRESIIGSPNTGGFMRTAKLSDFDFTPEPGFLYVSTRAISSRVNANWDGWPPAELRKAYGSFVGRPVFVDHNNWDTERSRGVVLDSRIHESKLASGHEDVWVELLIEVDAKQFPKLASAILSGDIDAVSMGADVEYTVCSICKNAARDVLEYCGHIPGLKGKMVESVDKTAGNKFRKLCYEDCYGVNFFEISFVFDPADESALISDVMLAPGSSHSGSREINIERNEASFAKVAQSKEEREQAEEETEQEMHPTKPLLALPAPVNTLRDEMDCPQCGAEWNGIICTSCGFELPPEGLQTPMMPMPFSMMGDGSSDEEASEEDGDSQKKAASKEAEKMIEKGKEEVMRVSRFEELRKQATLPQDPIYRQDTSPANSVPPYGTAIPGGTPVEGMEPALELGMPAKAEVRDLDAPDVMGPVGQPMVTVVNQQPGPTDVPPPGSQVGMALNGAGLSGTESTGMEAAPAMEAAPEGGEEKVASTVTAEQVTRTDVRNLDEPPAVNLGPDATINVMAPTAQPEQLALADTPDFINDGSETGVPAGADFRARLPEQFNPFNDAAARPYSMEEAGQMVAQAKTRVLRVANFVEERIEMGLSTPDRKFAEIARFEEMDDATLDGYIQATREFKATAARSASKRVRVAATNDEELAAPTRMPSLGSAPRVASIDSSDEMDLAMDYVAFL